MEERRRWVHTFLGVVSWICVSPYLSPYLCPCPYLYPYPSLDLSFVSLISSIIILYIIYKSIYYILYNKSILYIISVVI